jgi:hypothetical protein
MHIILAIYYHDRHIHEALGKYLIVFYKRGGF